MSMIRILADDLTGALDTAAAFAGEVPVFIDHPPQPGQRYFDAPISAVATPTRDIPEESLPDYLQPALFWLKSGTLPFKKVDSLLRGNTFAEIAWLLHHGKFKQAVFAPAFPAQGRITTENRQWVIKPGLPRQAVAEPLREAFASLSVQADTTESAEVWMPEVVSDTDLAGIALGSRNGEGADSLWCGSAGLAHAIAAQEGVAPPPGLAAPLPKEAGPTVLISASFQPVLREQWARLRAGVPVSAVAEHANDTEIQAAILRAAQAGCAAWFDLSPVEKITPEQAAQQLARHTAQLVAGLPKPGQLVVVGGDTLLSLCRTTGATALLARTSIQSGWGCARLVGGKWDGVPCYSRSGAFGGPDDLLTMMGCLTAT